MHTKNHKSHQAAAELRRTTSSHQNPSTHTAFFPLQKVSTTTYNTSLENPHNILTSSIEQLFYNASLSAPFDLRVLQYACYQCKTRLVKHISNLNSRYTNPNLVYELCTPCKYVFLSVSQKNCQKSKLLHQNSENSLESNPLQSTLLNDVFFSVPSPEKFETDDLELMKYDSTSSCADINSPTLSPTDFLIDEGENLFGFDLDPDFSSDQSNFGSSDTESSETASLPSSRSASVSKPKDTFELASPPFSPTLSTNVTEGTDLLEKIVEEEKLTEHPFLTSQKVERASIQVEKGKYSNSHCEERPSKFLKLSHNYFEHSIQHSPSTDNVCIGKEYSDEDELVGQENALIEITTSAQETNARTTSSPTIFQTLSEASIDWCRYCGTTEGVNWRPGPWGKRTLCNKHGCDYKGYGFACKLPRLNLTAYACETIEERIRPVLQHFCSICQKQESYVGNVMVMCEGCPKAFHQKCFPDGISDEIAKGCRPWFCHDACTENIKKRRIVVELPRKRLPLMCSPKSTPDSTKQKTAHRPETIRKPQTRKASRSFAVYESNLHQRVASKTQCITNAALSEQDSNSGISSRRMTSRSGGKNLSHYMSFSRSTNYYEPSSDSNEEDI